MYASMTYPIDQLLAFQPGGISLASGTAEESLEQCSFRSIGRRMEDRGSPLVCFYTSTPQQEPQSSILPCSAPCSLYHLDSSLRSDSCDSFAAPFPSLLRLIS